MDPLPNRVLLSVTKRHMATDFVLEVVVDRTAARIAENLLHDSHGILEKVEAALSEFREDSPVYRLNHASSEEWVPMNRYLGEILALSREYFNLGRGAFNPFARSAFPADFGDLEVDFSGARMRKVRAGLHMGFGAIGKGYALDRVASFLEREGQTDFRLGAGGSSWVFRGLGGDGGPWEIAWAWSRDADGDWQGQRYQLPAGRALAIGVSGTAEQGQHFFWGGAPISTAVQSSFCCGRSAAETDALSTALLVGASREGEKFLTTLPHDGIRGLCLAYVDLENQMIYNQAFETSFLREGRIL